MRMLSLIQCFLPVFFLDKHVLYRQCLQNGTIGNNCSSNLSNYNIVDMIQLRLRVESDLGANTIKPYPEVCLFSTV